jgi:hypothetical protein
VDDVKTILLTTLRSAEAAYEEAWKTHRSTIEQEFMKDFRVSDPWPHNRPYTDNGFSAVVSAWENLMKAHIAYSQWETKQ